MSLEVRVALDLGSRERISIEVSVNDLTVGCAALPVPNIHITIQVTAIASEDTEADEVGATTALGIELTTPLVADGLQRELVSGERLSPCAISDLVDLVERLIGIAQAIVCLSLYHQHLGITHQRHVEVRTIGARVVDSLSISTVVIPLHDRETIVEGRDLVCLTLADTTATATVEQGTVIAGLGDNLSGRRAILLV